MEKEAKGYNDYLQQQAWNYFQIHASQRLTTFNFYIVISSVITTGMVTTFQKEFRMPFGGVVLGVFLIFFSFVFWKLDRRNKSLIDHAESALRTFERETGLDSSSDLINNMKIFTRHEHETQKRKNSEKWFWNREFSYSDCFNLAFAGFAIVGGAGMLSSLINTFFITTRNKPSCVEVISNLLTNGLSLNY